MPDASPPANRLPHAIGRERLSLAGLAVIIGMHLLAGAALLAWEPGRRALLEVAPVMVRMIVPEPPPPPVVEPPRPLPVEPPPVQKPPPPKPKPRAVTPPVPQPPPVVEPPPAPIAVPDTAPAPPRIEAPVPTPEPPRPVPAPPPPPVAVAPAPPPPTPAVVVPPSFNAAYLSNPPPNYPAASRRMGEEGKVLVHVFVSAQGLPERIEVRTSSGYPRLDDAAAETIRRWKFVPARQGDANVAAWVIVPIVFTLNQ